MAYLKIIFYGILSFIERNPIFCLMMLLISIFAPFVFKWMLWVILALLAVALIGFIVWILRFFKMQRDMNNQFRKANGAGGFSGFGGFGNVNNGMSLEELVRQMQAQADAQQRKNTTTTEPKATKIENDKSGDYVDFEEVK